MLDFITERVNSWDYLKNTDLPIFIYGMGDGAEKILRVFDKYGIATAGFFASDEFVRGHYFKGHLVHSLSQIESLIEDFVIVLAFGAGYESLYRRISDMAERHILLAPDVPVVGEGLFTYEYCLENAEKLQRVYDMLADEKSKQTFADIINFRISGKIDYLHRCTVPKSEIWKDIIKLTDNERYIDLGAYNGDTVMEFSELTGGKYEHIYAVEPDSRNFRKLTKSTDGMKNITLENAAAWNENTELTFSDRSGRNSKLTDENGVKLKTVRGITGDSLCHNATLIKMDVEGAEYEALEGCKRSLEAGSRLICALYHRNGDIFELPLKVHEINPRLKLYIRHLLYIPAWETNLYCTL
ncbi:MAG: FkbM family methyltransferase [Oscillospiraceae bacterium]|nr:FkbM family methyltransferase [Oscillospiraceae bacterium]